MESEQKKAKKKRRFGVSKIGRKTRDAKRKSQRVTDPESANAINKSTETQIFRGFKPQALEPACVDVGPITENSASVEKQCHGTKIEVRIKDVRTHEGINRY